MIIGKSHIPEDRHILFLSSNDFQRFPKLVNTAIRLHEKSCYSRISLCNQVFCRSYLVVYFNIEINESLINLIESDENAEYKIYGILTIEYYDYMCEIFNVCTEKSKRNRGIMGKIFKNIYREFPSYRYWLGVLLNNPDRDGVLLFYLKQGFQPIGISYVSPNGLTTNTPFISLYTDQIYLKDFNKNIFINNLNIADSFVTAYKNSKKRCSMNFILKKEVSKTIYESYIYKDREYSGNFSLLKEDNSYILKLSNIRKGRKDRFEVSFPKSSYIHWHTHPSICYHENRCFIGWPSGLDISSIFTSYNEGLIGGFIFAKEGVYMLSVSFITASLMNFLTKNCINKFTGLIRFHFTSLEHYRDVNYDQTRLNCLKYFNNPKCYTFKNSVLNKSITQILQYVNNFTLEELFNNVPAESVPYFEVNAIKTCLGKALSALNASDIGFKIPNLQFPIFSMNFIAENEAIIRDIEIPHFFITPPLNSMCPLPVKGSNYEYFNYN